MEKQRLPTTTTTSKVRTSRAVQPRFKVTYFKALIRSSSCQYPDLRVKRGRAHIIPDDGRI